MRLMGIFMAALAFPILTAKANMIQCPGSQKIQSYTTQFIYDIKPVPFPQCFYIAKAVSLIDTNYCGQIYENINANLLKWNNLRIKNWSCHFTLENAQYKYSFTFAV